MQLPLLGLPLDPSICQIFDPHSTKPPWYASCQRAAGFLLASCSSLNTCRVLSLADCQLRLLVRSLLTRRSLVNSLARYFVTRHKSLACWVVSTRTTWWKGMAEWEIILGTKSSATCTTRCWRNSQRNPAAKRPSMMDSLPHRVIDEIQNVLGGRFLEPVTYGELLEEWVQFDQTGY